MSKGPSLVFIGSSSESKDIAERIHQGLEDRSADGTRICHATIWDEIFTPGDFVLERLLVESETFDYAVMLLSPNDYSVVRGKKHLVPRDNLNFELGIFMARLGRKYCIILRPNDIPIKLPTDLLGVTYITYNHGEYLSGQDNLRAQVTMIRNYIKENGTRNRKQEFFSGWGYDHEKKIFATSIYPDSLIPYSSGIYSLVIGCFTGEKADVFTAQKFTLGKVWEIPKNVPNELNFSVDCSALSNEIEIGNMVWGVLFLLRGTISLENLKNLGDINMRGGRVLDGKGCMAR